MRPTDGKRNSAYLIWLYIKSPLRHGRPTNRQSNSAHTRRIEMAAVISLRSSGRSCGNGGRLLCVSPYEKPHGVMSGDLGGQRSGAWSSAVLLPSPASGQMPLALPARTNKLGESLYVGRNLKSFPPHKYTDFVKHVRAL